MMSTRRLVLYGCGVALFLAILAALLAPDFLLSISRQEELNRTRDALDHGAPPLVDFYKGVFGPAGITDDQGIYVVVPVLSKLVGISDPGVGIKWLWLLLFVIPIALYPLIFARLFNNMTAALVAPWALAVGIVSFGFSEIYWIQPWAILTLIPPLILIAERRTNALFPIVALCMLGASFSSAVRSQAGTPVLIAGLIAIWLAGQVSRRRRLAVTVVAFACYFALQPAGMALLREQRNDYLGPHAATSIPPGHPFWHATYIGLGYLPNRWKIQWSDSSAALSASRVNPHAPYLSTAYEKTLRKLYFNVWKDSPGYVVGVTAQKASVVLRHSIIYLGFVVATLPWLLLVWDERRRVRLWLLLIAPSVLVAILNPLVTVPYRSYELGLFGALSLLSLLTVGALAEPVLRAPRRLLATLRLPSGKRAVLISGSILALLVVNFFVGGSIQNRAMDWVKQPLQRGPLP